MSYDAWKTRSPADDWCEDDEDLPSEADEIADNIIKMRGGRRPDSWHEAIALVSAYMGPRVEVGYQLFDNIAESLMRKTP